MATRTETIRAQLAERLQQLPDPQPQFALQIGWAADYDALFENRFSETRDAPSILEYARASGRVLLSGRGGGAKTVLLARTARIAASEGFATVFITLKEWTAADTPEWRKLTGSNERIAFLLERFSGVALLPRDLNALDSAQQKLVLLDGLNEVDSRTGQQVLHALDEYVRFSLTTSVIVSDRLTRRDFLLPQRWKLALVLPMTTDQVDAIVASDPRASALYHQASADEQSLLTTPYFLNAFLSGGSLASTIAGQMQQYFAQHALTDADVAHAATAAFDVYADATRTFSWQRFKTSAGDQIADRLVTAGAIVVEGDLAYFDHHLKHDYLASRVLLSDRESWTSDVFDTLTFHASSFDTIVMAMEQIESSPRADDLLRSLYDWNIYAAGYSIAEGRASRVSTDMQTVILGMFAERRWDLVTATAQRASDTLRLIDNSRAHKFLQAPSLEAVLHEIAKIRGETDWFPAWQRLFTRDIGTPAEPRDIEGLTTDDSVIGWTTANVLRRLSVSEEQLAEIRALLHSPNATVQWRAVHVLGVHPSELNKDCLLACLSSTSKNVRFGATRSLVEMAARGGADFPTLVFSGLAQNIDRVRAHTSTIAEFERAIFVQPDKAPNGWAQSVSIALIALQKASTEFEERERLDIVLARLVNTYGL